MFKFIPIVLFTFILACNDNHKEISAQQIVDNSIAVCGGDLFKDHTIGFNFRDIHYTSKQNNGQFVLTRKFKKDSSIILDVKTVNNFKRYVNDTLVVLKDSLANVYANSINSVHYFSKLPYGLNDQAVRKKMLGQCKIGGQSYYKVEITFNEKNGGEDFDDIYIYWFNTNTWKPDYLAYEFNVNGGGRRFRKAINERTINGIRFVDYLNYQPKNNKESIYTIDHAYENKALKLLSKIELKNIVVNPDSYN